MQNTNEKINEILNKNGKLKLSDITPEQIERGKDYISKLDLSKIIFNGKAIRFGDIKDPIELASYLTSKRKNSDLTEEYISHYTRFDVAKKIISSKKMQLRNPADMNDGLEFSSPKMDCSKMYFASFSIENSENIGMWSMYGQPWEAGIKISIPKKLFLSWADQIKQVYRVAPNTNEVISSSPLIESEFKASISRVGYVEWDTNGNVAQIRCGENSKNDKIKNVDTQILTGLIKDAAWSYEKEIRLRVDLNSNSDVKKVAVEIPDEIMKGIIITTGPRFNKMISSKEFADDIKMKKSIFAGKLNYVYCDKCKA